MCSKKENKELSEQLTKLEALLSSRVGESVTSRVNLESEIAELKAQ